MHHTSELTQPLWQRLVEQIRTRPIVGADKSRLVMQNDGTGKPKIPRVQITRSAPR